MAESIIKCMGSTKLLGTFSNTSEALLTLNDSTMKYNFILIEIRNANGAIFSSQITPCTEFMMHTSASNPYVFYSWDGNSWSDAYIKIISDTELSVFISSGNPVNIKGIV